MGNRKLIKLIPILILGFFIINFNTVFAYEIETHAYLTNEVVKFYNQNFPDNKIPDEFKNYLLNGSRREDDIPRWMNHFYDPVKDRGLTRDPAIDPLYALGAWQKSKDWAQDGHNQISALYNPILNSTLAAFYAATNPEKLKETDFSWQRAITDYVNGDQERAFYALGHILHLLEDKAVPDHTRNDPHLHGSPYEIFTEKYNLNAPDKNLNNQLADKKIYNLLGLEDYFKELANYSNNNFYSKDTIGIQSGYNLPQPDYIQKDGDYFYGFKTSKEGDNYRIFIKEKQSLFNTVISNTENITLLLNKEGGDKVMSDYWSRLSTKSVQYGAGVINLFFQEVEKTKNDPNFAKIESKSLFSKAIDLTKSFFAQIGNSISGIFKKDDGFQLAGQVNLNDNNQPKNSPISPISENQTPIAKIQSQEIQPQESQKTAPINQIQAESRSERSFATEEEADQEIIPEIQEGQKLVENQTQKEQLQIQQAQPLSIPKECSFNTAQFPSRQKIIINEIAWMGGSSDFGLTAADEWIELKNVSNSEVNLSGWQILDKSEKTRIVFDDSAKISANSFYLLERTNDDSAPNVSANSIYAGTLNNTDEGLRFFDNECNLIDEVFAEPNWPAGDNTQKRTMERSPDLSWHTYNGTAQNGIFGTPKKENSAPTIIFSDGGGGGNSSNNTSTDNQQQTTTNSTGSPEKILINEIEINPTTERFIELYNPNNTEISLTNWYLQRKTQTGSGFESLVSKTYFEGKTIPANGYFLISRSAFTDSNIVISNLTLSESNTIQLKDSNQEVADKVGWGNVSDFEGSASAPSPVSGQSIQRKSFIDTDNNAADFEIQSCPSPKAQTQTCQPASVNQAPSAFFVYTPTNPTVGDLITFDAASSTDSNGQIISYQWDFGDNATSSVSTATTTHAYSQAGNYTASLIVFSAGDGDDQNASSTPTSTIISIASSTPASPAPQLSEVNHVVISEIMAGITGNPNNEFIELYNPTNNTVSLSNWSLERKISQTATSTENLVLKFSATSTIAAKSFFLIGHGDYNGTSTPDFRYTNNSNPLAYSDDVVILYNNGEIVDEIAYQNIPAGQSIERKSFSGDVCVSAQNDNEFLGNACDTDSAADFEIRDVPNPQNSSSLPEPRNAPTTPQNFEIQYNANAMELIFNWSASQAASTSTYKITDISDASSTLSIIETASTTAKIFINEFGRNYTFSIEAFDEDGLSSSKIEKEISVPNSTLIIAQQLDKSVSEQGTGNGEFYQLLGNGLLGSPQDITFNAKFEWGYNDRFYHIAVTFWESDKSDYKNLRPVSTNTYYRENIDNYGLVGKILTGNGSGFEVKWNESNDYVIPIQEFFTFDPSKYYKVTFFTYQARVNFYGSADPNSYKNGKATKQDPQQGEILPLTIKDLYFVLNSRTPVEIPPPFASVAVQNFNITYEPATLELVFNWDKPRYFDTATSSLTYKITDISSVGSTPLIINNTLATNTSVLINEVGRVYKFSIQAFNETGADSIIDEKEIKIPYSLDEKFIIASQSTDKTISEQGTGNGQFYQTLGSGLSGKLGAVTFKADFNPTPYYINVDIFQSASSTYNNLEQFSKVALCNFNATSSEVDCLDQITENIITVPASKDFTFDPTKYYKLHFFTYQSTSNFYGSANETTYPNGQATKDNGGGAEILASSIKDLYFILTSQTPLR